MTWNKCMVIIRPINYLLRERRVGDFLGNRRPDADLMLGHRLRRWTNIKSTSGCILAGFKLKFQSHHMVLYKPLYRHVNTGEVKSA